MKVGVSTSSLFVRMFTEDALKYLCETGADSAEVFFASYREYNVEFGEKLRRIYGDSRMEIHSVHTLTTQFEPQLYSINKRAQDDSFEILDGVLAAAQCLGAAYYTFHGVARYKRTPMKLDFGRIAENTLRIMNACENRGVTLSYENVHWCYYNYIGFFKELKKRCPKLKGVLDIKQAYQSGISYEEYLGEMGGDIVTVHLSDRTADGKLCLPGQGIFDFDRLFCQLKDVGFDGAALIEAYQDDYSELSELSESVGFLKEKAYKYFG